MDPKEERVLLEKLAGGQQPTSQNSYSINFMTKICDQKFDILITIIAAHTVALNVVYELKAFDGLINDEKVASS